MYRTILAVSASIPIAYAASFAATYFLLCPLIFG